MSKLLGRSVYVDKVGCYWNATLVTEMLEDCSDGVIAQKSGLQKLIDIEKK